MFYEKNIILTSRRFSRSSSAIRFIRIRSRAATNEWKKKRKKNIPTKHHPNFRRGTQGEPHLKSYGSIVDSNYDALATPRLVCAGRHAAAEKKPIVPDAYKLMSRILLEIETEKKKNEN